MAERVQPLAAIPTLDEVLADPALAGRLPRHIAIEYRRVIRRLDADLEARIAGSADHLGTVREAENPDRAVGLDEAAEVIGMEKRTLQRKWKFVGGYKDIDGHVKFRLGDLRRHVARRSRSTG